MKKRGFTLAETLITLAIIGVVAALTIPILVASYQKTQYVTQLKKVYSQFSEAVDRFLLDEGVEKVTNTDWLYSDASEDLIEIESDLGKFFNKYFKVIKDCGHESPSHCFAENYTNINGDNISPISINRIGGYSVITADGTSVSISFNQLGYPPELAIDVNGLKKPNVGGRDLFAFSVYYDGSLEDGITPNDCSVYCGYTGGTKEEARENKFRDYCREGGYGAGCFGKILNDNWKMDY